MSLYCDACTFFFSFFLLYGYPDSFIYFYLVQILLLSFPIFSSFLNFLFLSLLVCIGDDLALCGVYWDILSCQLTRVQTMSNHVQCNYALPSWLVSPSEISQAATSVLGEDRLSGLYQSL